MRAITGEISKLGRPSLGEQSLIAAYLVDDTRFQAVLSKLHAHVADDLRYSQPAPYNQQLIDTLCLQPAAYLSGASLADVCTHFRQHYAVVIDPEKMYDPDGQDTIDSFYKCGPKYDCPGGVWSSTTKRFRALKARPNPSVLHRKKVRTLMI